MPDLIGRRGGGRTAHGVAVVGKGDLIGLSIAVAVCVAMRLAILPACNDLGHDEAITLLAATAHLDDFGRSDLRTDWVEVDRWKRLLALDEGATPSAIWRGLAKYDIHPPVYFWACNLWMRVVDAEPIGLRGFHVGCDVVSITLLFSLLKILGRSISEATAVAGAWSVGFPAVIASLELRMYSLATVSFLGFVVALMSLCRGGGGWTRSVAACALFGTTVAGTGTIYAFAVPTSAFAATAVILLLAGKKSVRGLLIATVFAAAGVMSATLHYATLSEQSSRFAGQGTSAGLPADASELIERFMLASRYLGLGLGLPYMVAVAALPLLIVAVACGVYAARTAPPEHRTVRMIWLVGSGFASAVYLTLPIIGASPAYTQSPKYLYFLWPCLFSTFAAFTRRGVGIVICVILATCQLWSVYEFAYGKYSFSRSEKVAAVFDTVAPRAVIDDQSRGFLMPLVAAIPDGVRIRVSDQERVLASDEAFVAELRSGEPGVYFGSPAAWGGGASPEGVDATAAAIGHGRPGRLLGVLGDDPWVVFVFLEEGSAEVRRARRDGR